jgi:hypothetical protein
MNRKALSLFAAAALAVGIGSAKAGNITTTDASLASPGGGTPGWFDGSGNPNGGFTVVTATDGVEVGLRAKNRQSPNVTTPTGVNNNTYVVPNGPETTATTGTSQSNANDAAWNYEFSIDVNPGGTGSLNLGDVTSANLLITDTTSGSTVTVGVLSTIPGSIPDDSGYGSSGVTSGSVSQPLTKAEWAAENSENPVFGALVFPQPYSMNASDDYTFVLTVATDTGDLISDTINVIVTPLPHSVWMGAALFGGLFVVSKLRRRVSPVLA